MCSILGQNYQFQISPPTITTDRSCGICPNGTFIQQGICVNASNCLPGYQQIAPSTSSSDRQCQVCLPGTIDPTSAGTGNCTLCSPGCYTPQASIGSCSSFLCAPGSCDIDSNPATPCVPCSGVYNYQNSAGQTYCINATVCGFGQRELLVSLFELRK